MAILFRKRIKIAPGVHLNLSRSGMSSTWGPKGFNVNVGKKGAFLNTGIPGSGIYQRRKIKGFNDGKTDPASAQITTTEKNDSNDRPYKIFRLILLFILGILTYAFWQNDLFPTSVFYGLSFLLGCWIIHTGIQILKHSQESKQESDTKTGDLPSRAADSENPDPTAQRIIRACAECTELAARIKSLEQKANALSKKQAGIWKWRKKRLAETEAEVSSCNRQLQELRERYEAARFDAGKEVPEPVKRWFREAMECAKDFTASEEIQELDDNKQWNYVSDFSIHIRQPWHYIKYDSEILFVSVHERSLYCIFPQFILAYEDEFSPVKILKIEELFLRESSRTAMVREKPSEAKILETTWKHTNKDGSPDMRYSCNPPLWQVEYGILEFSGRINTRFSFSRSSMLHDFVKNMSNIARIKELSRKISDNIKIDTEIRFREKEKPTNRPMENPIQQLDKLIGLESVKSEIQRLADLVKIQQERQRLGLKNPPINYHCVFTGNPGTGKTTVARIVAGIYKELGILKSGHLVETDRSGLVADYVGQTASKTNAIIDKALDGVLFIDEAYTLIADNTPNDFGHEAVATLLKRMEDNRDRLIVILAGYTDEIRKFILSNPGLQSRFNRYIEFPDYSASELYAIFLQNVQYSEYVLTTDACQKLRNMLDLAVQNKDRHFGNGRFVRNLFEKTIEHQSSRLSRLQTRTIDALMQIRAEDIPGEIPESHTDEELPVEEAPITEKPIEDEKPRVIYFDNPPKIQLSKESGNKGKKQKWMLKNEIEHQAFFRKFWNRYFPDKECEYCWLANGGCTIKFTANGKKRSTISIENLGLYGDQPYCDLVLLTMNNVPAKSKLTSADLNWRAAWNGVPIIHNIPLKDAEKIVEAFYEDIMNVARR